MVQQQQQTIIVIPVNEINSSSSSSSLKINEKNDSSSNRCSRCYSLPLFVIFISALEVGVFLFNILTIKQQQQQQQQLEQQSSTGPIQIDSILIYRPDRRQEIWRFITYMVLHANWFHLAFNVIVQLIIGIPLEICHGSIRIASIYLSGVLAGSLGTSIVDSQAYLIGASGGVYALLAAHIANIMLNYNEMKDGITKLALIFIFALCDFGYAIYLRNITEKNNIPSISYIAHLTGALAGLTIGILILKHFEHHTDKHLLWWSALGIYTAFIIFAIVFNLLNSITGQILEEKGEVIKQHLFHDLGVS